MLSLVDFPAPPRYHLRHSGQPAARPIINYRRIDMERKTETAMDFSPLITEYFRKTGMTQEKFAEAMDVSVSAVQYWMAGTNQPAPDKWQKVISTLDIPVNLWYRALNLEGKGIPSETVEDVTDMHDSMTQEPLDERMESPSDIPFGIYPEPVRRKDGSYIYREYYLPKIHSTQYAKHGYGENMQRAHYEVYVKSLADETIKKCTEIADRILKEGLDAKIASDDAWLASCNKRMSPKDKDGNRLCYVSSVSTTSVTYAMRALIRSVSLYIVFTQPREKQNAQFFREILLDWIKFTEYYSHNTHKYDMAIKYLEGDYVDDPIVDYYKIFKSNCDMGAKVSRRKSPDEIEATIIMILHDVLPAMDIDGMFDGIHNAAFNAADTYTEYIEKREKHNILRGLAEIPVGYIPEYLTTLRRPSVRAEKIWMEFE